MILKEGSTSFGIWREIPIPIYLECFLFNITNVDELIAGKNVTMQVQELGPFVFREINKKVSFNNICLHFNLLLCMKSDSLIY